MKTFLIAALSIAAYTSTAQKYNLQEYEDLTDRLLNDYYDALTNEDNWRPYVNKLDDLNNDMEEDLKGDSGLSFDDMNQVRKLKAVLRKMRDFGYGVAVGSSFKTFNGRMLREIREVFPEITMRLITENSCVSFYQVTILNYVVVVARHNERGVEKKINYWDKSGKCGSIAFGGTISLYPGVYRTIWQNIKCPSYDGSQIFIKSCTFERPWDTFIEPVESFKD